MIVKHVGSRIVLQTVYADRERVRAIPGVRWDNLTKCWTLPATPGFYARVLEIAQPDDTIDCAVLADRLRARSTKPSHPDDVDCAYLKTLPWAHQKRALQFSLHADAGLLHMHMGTGKSKVILDTVKLLAHRRTLILCPKSVIRVWEIQAQKHSDFHPLCLSDGTVTRRAARLLLALEQRTPLIAVVNYEAAWHSGLARTILGVEWDCLVMDESQKVKAPGGKASRFCASIRARQRLALTGTPMPHSPLDIYGQYRALDPGIFGLSFTQFRSEYAVMGGYQQHQVVAYRNEKDLRARMDTIRFEVKADALSLPPLVTQDVPVKLEATAARHYQEMEQDFITRVKDGEITAKNALSKLLRLQQVTSGFLPAIDEAGAPAVEIGTEKREALEELLEDAGTEPVVVFARFRHDLTQIHKAAEKVGRTCGEVSGSANTMIEWDAGKLNTIAIQIQAGGLGIDLTRARYAVYFSLGYSLGDYDQTVARLHRPGQTRPVTVYRLLAEKSVDSKIAAALDKKRDVIEAILSDALKPAGGE